MLVVQVELNLMARPYVSNALLVLAFLYMDKTSKEEQPRGSLEEPLCLRVRATTPSCEAAGVQSGVRID